MGARLNSVGLKSVRIDDAFWNTYVKLVDDVILPFQWELINDRADDSPQFRKTSSPVGFQWKPLDDRSEDTERSGCIRNFRIAGGKEQGEHRGTVFQDTDLAKWLEAVAYSLHKKKNAELEALADSAIDLIVAAQCEDGYINTYYTITGEERWSNLFEGHELYTAGHMIEAAVAYYEATGKRKLLDALCRFADLIDEVFGREAGKLRGYPGHPEIELALVRLYRVTGEERYLKLADYFVRERGTQPCYFLREKGLRTQNFLFPEFKDFGFDYMQAHVPLAQQTAAEGHAVRAVYLYSAMADLAAVLQDAELLRQCETIWGNIVKKRMYITGSIGSAAYGERFTTDYDLPNDTNYSESCATVGLAMFSNRMLQITRDGKYADVLELALYNTLLAGIAADGRHFFYVNPLEVVPEIAQKNPTMRHIEPSRQQWFGVACCPPNIARTLASLGNYMYAVDTNAVYVNLFIASDMEAQLDTGKVSVHMQACYPNEGEVCIRVSPERAGQSFTLAVRRPAHAKTASVLVNGSEVPCKLKKGYFYLDRAWNEGDVVVVTLDVSFRFVRCNPRVRNNLNRVSLMRGPWVYCLEQADNSDYLSSARIDTQTPPAACFVDTLPYDAVCASLQGEKIRYDDVPEELYGESRPTYEKTVLHAVPYCLWNNRGQGEMLVWMREKETP